jgi:cupin fold WbuC family metalloprotein
MYEVRSIMKIIDKQLLDDVSIQAQESPRLRMNYNFHQSLDDKCHRFLNAVEPGTKVEIHRHPTKDESFVLLRGKVRVNTYNDDGSVLESVVLCPAEGLYGVDIPKGIWHNVESLESGSVFFECKEGPFVPHEKEGVLIVNR